MTTDVASPYQYLLVSREAAGPDVPPEARKIGLVRLNRPSALNALSPELMQELVSALEAFDADDGIGCMVLTGSEKAFAAGADIQWMAESSADAMRQSDPLALWDHIAALKKPLIAAVSGYALGGGLEVAMMADMIIAGDNARFGQPEISIGVIPGAGGTQRLTRMVGKALAMELILTGRTFHAAEAFAMGLVNRVVPADQLLTEALSLAGMIATKPAEALRCAKEAVLKAQELPLTDGLAVERVMFYNLFDTEDQKEGMRAFLEKRTPIWQHT